MINLWSSLGGLWSDLIGCAQINVGYVHLWIKREINLVQNEVRGCMRTAWVYIYALNKKENEKFNFHLGVRKEKGNGYINYAQQLLCL